ncbi:MAG: hypothetical protein ACJLS3_04545 [Erythrobacter sp.]
MEVMSADEIGLVSGGGRCHNHPHTGLISFAAISVGKDSLPDQFKPKVETVKFGGLTPYEEFIDPDNPPEIPPKS